MENPISMAVEKLTTHAVKKNPNVLTSSSKPTLQYRTPQNAAAAATTGGHLHQHPVRDVGSGSVVRVVELARVHLAVELHLLHEHLRHEAGQDHGDEQDADGVEDAHQPSVLAVEEAGQQTGEQHVE
jgi:hypothetical protein